MKGTKDVEAEARKRKATCLDQCLIILLEARARECIEVASGNAKRKRGRAALRGATYENASSHIDTTRSHCELRVTRAKLG